MGAFQLTVSNGSAKARGIRTAVLANRPVDRADIASLLDKAMRGRLAAGYRGDLSNFWSSGKVSSVDVALILLDDEPTEIVKAQIGALTRSAGVVLIGAQHIVVKLMAADGMRARACLCRDDLTPNSLETAMHGLLSARASEDRLLRVVANQSAQVQQLRNSGARLAREIDIAVEAFGAFTREIADLAANRRTKRAMALAADAVAGLDEVRSEFDRSVRGLAVQQALLAPANLNSVIEGFVRNMSGAGASNVSVLTSFDPIFVRADGASVWRLLDCVLQAWRQVRRPVDRLELLSWDAGADAKLAIVFSKHTNAFPTNEQPTAISASSPEFLRRLCQDLRLHAEICGARIEADRGSPAASKVNLTLSLPKKSSAPLYPLAAAKPVLREPMDAPL